MQGIRESYAVWCCHRLGTENTKLRGNTHRDIQAAEMMGV